METDGAEPVMPDAAAVVSSDDDEVIISLESVCDDVPVHAVKENIIAAANNIEAEFRVDRNFSIYIMSFPAFPG